jgi:hypothetical protein
MSLKSPTGKELLENKDFQIDRSKYRPSEPMHPKAHIYNVQYKSLELMAEQMPKRAIDCYEQLAKLDQSLEVSVTPWFIDE